MCCARDATFVSDPAKRISLQFGVMANLCFFVRPILKIEHLVMENIAKVVLCP